MLCFWRKLILVNIILIFQFLNIFSEDTSQIKIVPTVMSKFELGQIVRGYDKNVGEIYNVTIDRIYLRGGFNVHFSTKTDFIGNIEVKAFNEFPRQVINGFTRRYYYYFYLTQAELIHNIIDYEGVKSVIGGGYFPYKYNSNIKNLGEYLFRSTAYPQTLTTEFDFPFARLAGIYSKNSFSFGNSSLCLEIISHINTEWMAIGDLNLSFISGYNFKNLFDIGVGVQFGSIISADENVTTPKNNATKYWAGNDTSNYYTFRGTKLMGMLSFDPKFLFPSTIKNIFRENELIIYSEAAFLGIKNYDVAVNSPIWYNSPLERIPVVCGINLPTNQLLSYSIIPGIMGYYLELIENKRIRKAITCGLIGSILGFGSWFIDYKYNFNSKLDLLSIEAEWWGNRYPNSMQAIVQDGLPLPFLQGTKEIDSLPYKEDNIKWSIYGIKTISNHYRFAFQVASDHMRTFAWDWNRQDWEEALRSPKKWYYMISFGVLF